MQPIAPLKFVHNMLLRNLIRWHRGNCLMVGGIERLSDRWNGLDAELSQGAVQLFEGQVDALNQTIS